jgi:hypothetical protein
MENNNLIIFSIISSILYCIIKYLESILIKKQSIALRDLIRDSIIIFISIYVGNFILEQVYQSNTSNVKPSTVFTDNPDF